MWRMFTRRNAAAPVALAADDALPEPLVVASTSRAATAPTLPDASRAIAHMQRLGDAVVATMTPACVCGADGVTFTGVLRTLLEHRNARCILDLQNVAQFDEPAVQQLHRFINDAHEQGMRVAIASASPNLTNHLNLTLLAHPVPVSRDVMSALEALRRQSPEFAET